MLNHGKHIDVFDKNFDLKEQFKKDFSGNALRSVVNALKEAETSIRKQIDKGVPPEEFTKLSLLKQAFEIAQANI
ncbi:MAG: hypothetical protein K2M30_01350, partial [Desulfovibrionaceae bacterium]|nr:hypothetical protein [Desulfovibrionaceae bacterium]